jgi:hypothetical protein
MEMIKTRHESYLGVIHDITNHRHKA